MDYHGEKRSLIKRGFFHSSTLGILGNSLFFRMGFSFNVYKLNLTNMNQLRLTFLETLRVLVIDSSRQPEGKIYISNTMHPFNVDKFGTFFEKIVILSLFSYISYV